MSTVHVVGAGMAGLAAAVRLAEAGRRVVLHEAAPHAGGRCRSFFDEALGATIDNGNHLLMSGNRSAMRYLDIIGARASLEGPEYAAYPFFDLATGERWTARPNGGPVPWWIFSKSRRVPGTRAADYLSALRILRSRSDQVVTDCVDPASALFKRFWEPLTLAALNAPADEAAAVLLKPVLLETFAKGEAHCRPLIARDGLSASLVNPALAFLEGRGASVRLGERLRGLTMVGDQVTELQFTRGAEALAEADAVVLALPRRAMADILPDCPRPVGSFPIVNVHYHMTAPPETQPDAPLIGLIGGVAHWVFLRGRIASVTVSGASTLAEEPAERIGAQIWAEVARAINAPEHPAPPHRVVKEKRATFAQIPSQLDFRPKTATKWRNLLLAGDWTATGLPATIEGAVWSGFEAADRALRLSR